MDLKFLSLQENHLDLLHQWFSEPVVNQTYARNKSWTLEKIKTKYLPRIQCAIGFLFVDDNTMALERLCLKKLHL